MLSCNNLCMQSEYIYKHIGSTIKNRRKALKMTQEVLASKLFMSRASLASIEVGRQNVLVHQLYSFAKILELEISDFLAPLDPANTSDKSVNFSFSVPLNAQQKDQLARLIEK